MFKLLSIFKRNYDEQLADNHYDFNEIPVSEIDVGGIVENQMPASGDMAPAKRQEAPLLAGPSINAGREADSVKARIEGVRANLSALRGNNGTRSGEVHTSAVSTSPDVESASLQPPNLDLVKGYRESREEKDPGITMYTSPDGSIELRFINAKHHRVGTISGMDDPTLETVRRVIEDKTNKPDFVIGEGHATDMTDAARKNLLSQNIELAKAGGEIPESGYAMYLAHQAEPQIQYIGGEISGAELFKQMQEQHGYSIQDVLAVNLMQQLSAEKAETTDETEVETQYAYKLQKIIKRIDPKDELKLQPANFTFDQFKNWCSEKKPFLDPKGTSSEQTTREDFLSVSQDDFVPNIEGNFFQKWMAYSGEERDKHIASLLYENLNKPRKAGNEPRRGVIVYGADHLNSLDPVIQQMLGGRPSEYAQLVPSKTLDGNAA